MKIKKVISKDPVCCLVTNTAQDVAKTLCNPNICSIPVVLDHQSRELDGIITDRDLSCSVL